MAWRRDPLRNVEPALRATHLSEVSLWRDSSSDLHVSGDEAYAWAVVWRRSNKTSFASENEAG
jgi:hypothetical protein